MQLKLKTLRFDHSFLNTCTGKIQISQDQKLKILVEKHFKAYLGQLTICKASQVI